MANELTARRFEIEAHVELCRDAAQQNLIEMGRWLLAAKEEGVVPHGEWTAWVREHAGVNERTAQRLMRAAREIPEGSALSGLPMAKLDELLRLPEGDRELAANLMGAEDLSAREVRQKVDGLMGKEKALDPGEALRVAKAAKEDKEAAVRQAVAEAEEKARQQMAELQRRVDRLESTYQAQVEKLRQQREDFAAAMAERQAAEKKAGLEYHELQKKLNAAEEENDRLADALDRARMDDAQGDQSPAPRILSAVGGMIAMVGQDPARLRADPSLLTEEDRGMVLDKVRAVKTWCFAMEEALTWAT